MQHVPNLLTGHLILIWVPRKTVAAPPIFSVTFVFCGSCWMYVVLLDAIGGRWSSGAHGFVLHSLVAAGFMLGHNSSRRSTLCSWAMICLHSTFRCLIPPPHGLWMGDKCVVDDAHVNRIDTRTCYISTMPILPIAPDNRVCCSIAAVMVAAAGTSNPARPLCCRRRASPRECIEPHAPGHRYRMTSSTANSPSNSIVADTVDRCMCEFVPPAWFRANTKMVTPPCQCLRARNL